MTEPFLWGVATSAYQAEGGYNAPGQPLTNWAAAEERQDVAASGNASGFWEAYEADFARCRAMGLNAFRIGIEWSRCHTMDASVLDHYAAMLRSCRAHGLEPVVTLHHFVHPAHLGADPWLDAATPSLFADYARELVARLNERLDAPLRWFITINEPNMLVLNTYLGRQFPSEVGVGFSHVTTAYNHLLRAHVLTYRALHELYTQHDWQAPRVAFNNYCSDLYWSDKMLLDLAFARQRGIARDAIQTYICRAAEAFDHTFRAARLPFRRDAAFWFGSLFKRVTNWLGYRRFDAEHFAPFLDTLYEGGSGSVMDFIGLDYYDPFAAHIFRWPVLWDHEFKNRSLRSWMLSSLTSKWWDWRVLPAGLGFFCSHYASEYGLPVLIAENGLAIRRRPDNHGLTPRRDKITRSEFLRLHVAEVRTMLAAGVPLLGYLHWSLFDNYEWGSFTPRFGLFSIDYTRGTSRDAIDPWGDSPSETYATLIRDARQSTSERITREG